MLPLNIFSIEHKEFIIDGKKICYSEYKNDGKSYIINFHSTDNTGSIRDITEKVTAIIKNDKVERVAMDPDPFWGFSFYRSLNPTDYYHLLALYRSVQKDFETKK